MTTDFHVREMFHLHVLRQLSSRLAARPYAVKGGTAVRDLFDLHHLFFQTGTGMSPPPQSDNAALLEKTIEKVGHFEYGDFRDQVLPYLTGNLQASLGNAAAFHALREAVEHQLMELLP